MKETKVIMLLHTNCPYCRQWTINFSFQQEKKLRKGISIDKKCYQCMKKFKVIPNLRIGGLVEEGGL